MMPLTVIRTWILGLLSWAMLGVGLYLIWEWADGVDPAIQSQRVRNLDTGELETRLVRVPDDERDTRGGTPYLAWGLLLAGFSFGGFIPARLILGKSPSDKPRPMHGGEQLEVSAPDGSKLHVEIYGADNQPTLLLTHGWSLDHTAWSYVQQRLSDRFRIVVWDLPGLGRSQRPQRSDYSMENMSRCLAAVMDATANGPVILVGHSFGGMLLQTYCRMFPEYAQKVSALVLVHTTYTNPLRTALGSSIWTAIQKPILDPLNYLTIWLSPLVWLSNWQSYFNGSLQVSSRISSFAGTQTWGQIDYSSWLFAKASPAVVARGNFAMEAFDEQDSLRSVQVPVLIFSGSNDRLTKPEASDRLEQLLPNAAQSQLHPAGHLGYWEHHDIFAQTLAEFAGKHGAVSTPLVEKVNSTER